MKTYGSQPRKPPPPKRHVRFILKSPRNFSLRYLVTTVRNRAGPCTRYYVRLTWCPAKSFGVDGNSNFFLSVEGNLFFENSCETKPFDARDVSIPIKRYKILFHSLYTHRTYCSMGKRAIDSPPVTHGPDKNLFSAIYCRPKPELHCLSCNRLRNEFINELRSTLTVNR